MSTVPPADDVVRLLEEDHRLIERRFEELDSVGASVRSELFWKLTNDLVRHEVAEEIVVYPALRKVPGGAAVADARVAEHFDAKEQLSRMERMDAENPEFMIDLVAMESAVLQHAKAEEATAFALLLGAVAPDERVEMGIRYMEAKDAAPTRPHPRVADTPPGILVLGSVAALADRVRDAAATV